MNQIRILLLLIAPAMFGDGPSVALHRQGDKATVDVGGLSQADLDRLAKADWEAREWASVFAVYVAGQGSGRTPILGMYRVEGGRLKFEPRFPFIPGLRYRAEFHPGLLSGREDLAPVTAEFTLPKPAPAAPTVVRQVYPSRSTLPENLLKFYIHFSAPMSQGDAYDFVHILDARGEEIEGAFLKLDDELWDRDGLRLTLLIDPGRIKRDVGPREGLGPVLEAGKDYTLLVDAQWPDAEGRPLGASHRKAFRTTAADAACPDIQAWRIRPPAAGSTDPLIVESPEPLDQALFSRLVRVQGADGRDVPGRAAVTDEETRWSFTPDRPWTGGAYQLAVGAALEDLAGNNLQRPFELDVFESVGRRLEAPIVRRPFEVR